MATRGTKTESKATKDAKEAMRESLEKGIMYPTPIPYGQWDKADDLKRDEVKYVRTYWEKLEKNGEWPEDLLSFEAWCGMTNYDDSQEDGGKPFQKLMLKMLATAGTASTHHRKWPPQSKNQTDEYEFDYMWHAEQRKYGPMFKLDIKGVEYNFNHKKPPNMFYEGNDASNAPMMYEYVNDKKQTVVESIGAHLSVHSRPIVSWAGNGKQSKSTKIGEPQTLGITLGNKSGKTKAITDNGLVSRFVTNANHYVVYSKHDWLLKGFLQTGLKGANVGERSQSLGQGYISIGLDKIKEGAQGQSAGQCWEVTKFTDENDLQNDKHDEKPCMLVANSMAAVYGLYYYPGCRNDDLNWEVEEYVPEVKKRFRIRFRCPNPMYGQRFEKPWFKMNKPALDAFNELHVYEELNSLNKQKLNTILELHRQAINRGKTVKLAKRPDAKYVGGVYGDQTDTNLKNTLPHFTVPKAGRLRAIKDKDEASHPTVSPWMYLINKSNKMQVAPFWNTSALSTQPDWHTIDEMSANQFLRSEIMRNEHNILVAGEIKNNVGFGYRMSQAFLLYPHRKPKQQYLYATTSAFVQRSQYNKEYYTNHNLLSTVQRYVGYMTEPQLKSTLDTNPDDRNRSLAQLMLNYDDYFADGNFTEENWRKLLLEEDNENLSSQPGTSAAHASLPQPLPRKKGKAPMNVSVQLAPSSGSAASSVPTADLMPSNIINTGTGAEVDETIPEEVQELMRPTVTNNDIAMREDNALMQESMKNVIEINYGIPGMSLAEMLKECDPSADNVTEKDIRRIINKPVGKNEEKLSQWGAADRKLYQLLKHCNMTNPVLEAGQPKKLMTNEQQCHWRTARHAPWQHSQLYKPAKMIYDCELMNQTKIDEHKRKYGQQANLIQTDDSNIKRIKGIKLEWGYHNADIFETPLNANNDVSLLNYAKILIIYFDNSGIGEDGNVQMTPDQKRQGMCKGLGYEINKRAETINVTVMKQKSSAFKLLFKPVFQCKPEDVLSDELIECLKDYMCKREVTDADELLKCLNKHSNWREQLRKVKTKMKVGEWIQTPWHLEHLPYQPQFAVFRDGETFSEGCKRCSRRFYEYAYHMYGDRQAKKNTTSYTQDMWYSKDFTTDGIIRAALPFHDPEFWVNANTDGKYLWTNAKTVSPGNLAEGGVYLPKQPGDPGRVEKKVRGEAELQTAEVERPDVAREYDFFTGGTMAWPMYQLLKGRLHSKDQKRSAIGGAQKTGALYFRRYLNVAYSSDVIEDAEQTYYAKDQVQGYMFGGNKKIKFGHSSLRVTRAYKYGNICRDCAAVLDRAPGLFIRNTRFQFSDGLVNQNMSQINEAKQDFWQHVFKGSGSNDYSHNYDALFYKANRLNNVTLSNVDQAIRTQIVADFDKVAAQMSADMQNMHKFPDKWTKLIEQPSIHTQGSVKKFENMEDDQFADALKALNNLLKNGHATIAANQAALTTIVREAERKYFHNKAYTQIDYTRQFDSDVKRFEYRNCVIRWASVDIDNELQSVLIWLNPPEEPTPKFKYDSIETGITGKQLPYNQRRYGKLTHNRYIKSMATNEVYYNCLITEQYVMPEVKERNFAEARNANNYHIEVYLSNRVGRDGQQEHPASVPTQWKGDGNVCEFRKEGEAWHALQTESGGRAQKQIRTMRQSRIFITYSLHRSISGEAEGRVILEKMADALYKLFGEDRWLSQMIVFGKQLKQFDVAAQNRDNVSSMQWNIIDKTKKEDAMDTFYGGDRKTSYVYDTYETHMNYVEVDAGCEIGPKMGHPHFHLMLTMSHYSYVQFDTFKMSTFLEIMFKGIETFHGWGKAYELPGNFYGDNENPYVHIKLYPQDNWKEILAAYVRKNTIPSIVEVERRRAGA